jgi:uncharacterized protein
VDFAAYRQSLGLTHLIDIHTHFMPERVLAKVWARVDEAGPLVGRDWRIAHRQPEQQRLEILRGFGVRAVERPLWSGCGEPDDGRWARAALGPDLGESGRV